MNQLRFVIAEIVEKRKGKMNKTELAKKVSNTIGIAKTEIEKVIDAMCVEITYALKDGDAVSIRNFATFEPVTRADRVGRNPSTGEIVEYPSKVVPKCKFSKHVKDIVSKDE